MNIRKILVERPLFDEFLERFVGRAKAIEAGDSTGANDRIGPLPMSKRPLAASPAAHGRWAVDMFTDLDLVTVSQHGHQYPL